MAAVWEPAPPEPAPSNPTTMRIMALARVPIGEGEQQQLLTRGVEYDLPSDQANRLLSFGLAVRIPTEPATPRSSSFSMRSLLLRLGFSV